jgi:hypothetical protein
VDFVPKEIIEKLPSRFLPPICHDRLTYNAA